jgi:hypothetical protein
VPPGVVASPFFSADPAVPEPCVLASFADGIELPVVVVGLVASFFIAAPPPVVVPPSIDPPVVDLLAAGPPALESPPAVLDCANDIVLASAKAAASPMIDLICIVGFLPNYALGEQSVFGYFVPHRAVAPRGLDDAPSSQDCCPQTVDVSFAPVGFRPF